MTYKIKPYIGNIITYNDFDGEYFHISNTEHRLCIVVNDNLVYDFNTGDLIPALDRDENGDIYNLIYANQMYLDYLIQLDEKTEVELLPLCVEKFKEILIKKWKKRNILK